MEHSHVCVYLALLPSWTVPTCFTLCLAVNLRYNSLAASEPIRQFIFRACSRGCGVLRPQRSNSAAHTGADSVSQVCLVHIPQVRHRLGQVICRHQNKSI